MPSSISSTTCSEPKNDTVERVLQNDKVRYVRKGYGLVSAFIIFLGYFYFAPIWLKNIWEDYLSLGDANNVLFLTAVFHPFFIFYFANLIMWFIYTQKIPFFERYRIQEKPWPWEKDPKKWSVLVKKTFKNVLFNQLIVTPLMSGLNIYILGLKCRTGIDTFPGHKEIILHVLFMMFTEDLCFYWSHRLLHHRKVYPIIHKTHHEYFNSVSICALYAHPFEFLFSNTMSTAMGFLILGPNAHIASFYIWLTIRIFETIDGHCGYEFSWSPFRLLPLSGSSEYHNFHHSHNLGTYGSFFTFWDTVCGTNKDYFQYKSRKESEYALNVLRQDFKKTQEQGAVLGKENIKKLAEVPKIKEVIKE